MKTFLYAGFSTHKRRIRLRFANDAGRVKTLERNGHTDINIFALPYAMCKLDAVKWLIDNHFDGGDEAVRYAFGNELARLEIGSNVEVEAEEEAAEVEEEVA